jgi:hypothetical protein
LAEIEEIKQETPHAWAKITRSSSKDGGTGFEYGYSSPTGDTDEVAAGLIRLRTAVEGLVK